MKFKILSILSISIYITASFAAESNNLIIDTGSNSVVATSLTNKQANSEVISSNTAKPKVSNKKQKRKIIKNKGYQNISQMNFDFTYSGDLPGALKHLQEYDYTLIISSPLGKKQDTQVSIDLQNTTLDSVLSSINSQIDGYGSVKYNPNNNSIKIIYTSKIRDIGYDAMMESKKWRDGHKPKPIITPDGILQYPFGFYQPVIPCKIGIICDIRLGAGEVLMDWAISDVGNWQMYSKSNGRDGSNTEPSLGFSGSGSNIIPHILIKPTTAATTTNLVVLTNLRTYNMLLKATNDDYVLSAGFYYPNDLMQGVEAEKQKIRNQSLDGVILKNNDNDNSNQSDAYNIDIAKLNYNNYEISGDDVPWKPTSIIDDGEKVWIKFADNNQVSPILVETNEDNQEQPYKLIRYFPQPGNMYLVNRMFDEVLLIKGINDQTKVVKIKRKKTESSLWHKIFG